MKSNKQTIRFKINGQERTLNTSPYNTLLRLLRDDLGHMEVKDGCEKGDCGACTVLLNGKPVNSCLVFAGQVDGADVITVKALGTHDSLSHLQKSFVEQGAVQCGFCTPGMLLVAKNLLDKNPHPSRNEIIEAISGNLCRCTGYQSIVNAIESVCKKRD